MTYLCEHIALDTFEVSIEVLCEVLEGHIRGEIEWKDAPRPSPEFIEACYPDYPDGWGPLFVPDAAPTWVVAPGDKVQLLVDRFPADEYGRVRRAITAVTGDPPKRVAILGWFRE